MKPPIFEKDIDLRIGAKLRIAPSTFYDPHGAMLPGGNSISGTVVYINERHRYFTLEYQFMFGKFRESFKYIKESDISGGNAKFSANYYYKRRALPGYSRQYQFRG